MRKITLENGTEVQISEEIMNNIKMYLLLFLILSNVLLLIAHNILVNEYEELKSTYVESQNEVNYCSEVLKNIIIQEKELF